eukprot:7680124-Alexandrium_andersonii.AAC.1
MCIRDSLCAVQETQSCQTRYWAFYFELRTSKQIHRSRTQHVAIHKSAFRQLTNCKSAVVFSRLRVTAEAKRRSHPAPSMVLCWRNRGCEASK